MAIYHLHQDFVSRSTGRSVVQTAAYIMGLDLHETYRNQSAPYRNKNGEVSFSATLAPAHCSDKWRSVEIWDTFENYEDTYAYQRYPYCKNSRDKQLKSAQSGMTNEVALPRELPLEISDELLRAFIEERFISRGLVASYCIHKKEGNPHGHILISRRSVDEFGNMSWAKDRTIAEQPALIETRRIWADFANKYLEREGYSERITEKSYADLGIRLLPTHHRGYNADKLQREGKQSRIVFENEKIYHENRNRIIADPTIILEELNVTHATFSQRDILRIIQKRVGDDPHLINPVFETVMQHTVVIGSTIDGTIRYSGEAYITLEKDTVCLLEAIKTTHTSLNISPTHVDTLVKNTFSYLNEDQQHALHSLVKADQFKALIGRAGTGKSTLLGAMTQLMKDQGYTVFGGALKGDVADTLHEDLKIESRTLASWTHLWDIYEEAEASFLSFDAIINKGILQQLAWYQDLMRTKEFYPTNKTVFVLDEAGMVGTKDWNRLLKVIQKTGALLRVVGDDNQLKPIDAGDFFRLCLKETEPAVLSTVVRQKVDWMKEASRAFFELDSATGLACYEHHDAVHLMSESAIADAIATRYVAHRITQKHAGENPNALVLAYTNRECDHLNATIRTHLKQNGLLPEQDVLTFNGKRYAIGDELVFLKNESRSSVMTLISSDGEVLRTRIRNGTKGTLLSVVSKETLSKDGVAQSTHTLTVQLSKDRTVVFKTTDYTHFTHRYAVTIHKSQGETGSVSFVKSSIYMSANALMVAMTRHKDLCHFYADTETTPTFKKLQEQYSRLDPKDTVSDYTITPENKLFYDRVQTYIHQGNNIGLLLNDGAVCSDEMNALQFTRKEVALAILADPKSHATFLRQACLTVEMLEIRCGLKERALSRAEEIALNRIEQYVEVAKTARRVWNDIKETNEEHHAVHSIDDRSEEPHTRNQSTQRKTNVFQHPLYSSFAKLQGLRDELSYEIIQNEPLHRSFFNSIFKTLGYGRGVLIHQSNAHDLRLTEMPCINEIQEAIALWHKSESSNSTISFYNHENSDERFHRKGSAASTLVTLHQDDKAFNRASLTFKLLSMDGIDYRDLLHAAKDYQRYQFADAFDAATEKESRDMAFSLLSYQHAKQNVAILYQTCTNEIEPTLEEKARIESGEGVQKSFWHAPSYAAYVRASTYANGCAFELTNGRATSFTPKLQHMAETLSITLHHLDQQGHQGELQHFCDVFKATDALLVKGMIAHELLDWLAVDRSLGGKKTTYQILARAELNWSELFESIQCYDRAILTSTLTPSQKELAPHVFAYMEHRVSVGKAFAAVLEDIAQKNKEIAERNAVLKNALNAHGKPITASGKDSAFETHLQPWDAGESYQEFIHARRPLNAEAHVLHHATEADREPFTDNFRLKPLLLKRQAQRHALEIGYETVVNAELPTFERLKACLFIERHLNDTHDKTLRAHIRNINDDALKQELKEHLDHRRGDAWSCLLNSETNPESKTSRYAQLQTVTSTVFERFKQQQSNTHYFEIVSASEREEHLYQAERDLTCAPVLRRVEMHLAERGIPFTSAQQRTVEPTVSTSMIKQPTPSNHTEIQPLTVREKKPMTTQNRQNAQTEHKAAHADSSRTPYRKTPHTQKDTHLSREELQAFTNTVKKQLHTDIEQVAVQLLGQPKEMGRDGIWKWSGGIRLHTRSGVVPRGTFKIYSEETRNMDVFEMIQRTQGTQTFFESVKKGGEFCGLFLERQNSLQRPITPASLKTGIKIQKDTSVDSAKELKEYTPLFPVPKDHERINIEKHKGLSFMLNRPNGEKWHETMRFAYRDETNHLLGYVIRLENEQGQKETLPLTYCIDNGTGKTGWKWKGFGENRPLYGLDRLGKHPDKPVLLVEGEKAADAAQKLFPDLVVMSWVGGSAGVHKVDLAPIQNKTIIMWPDNDEAGFKAAQTLHERFNTHARGKKRSSTFAIINIPSNQLPPTWDLADPLPTSMNMDDIHNLVQKTLHTAGQHDVSADHTLAHSMHPVTTNEIHTHLTTKSTDSSDIQTRANEQMNQHAHQPHPRTFSYEEIVQHAAQENLTFLMETTERVPLMVHIANETYKELNQWHALAGIAQDTNHIERQAILTGLYTAMAKDMLEGCNEKNQSLHKANLIGAVAGRTHINGTKKDAHDHIFAAQKEVNDFESALKKQQQDPAHEKNTVSSVIHEEIERASFHCQHLIGRDMSSEIKQTCLKVLHETYHPMHHHKSPAHAKQQIMQSMIKHVITQKAKGVEEMKPITHEEAVHIHAQQEQQRQHVMQQTHEHMKHMEHHQTLQRQHSRGMEL